MKQPRLRAWRLARAARRAEHQTPPSPAASDLPAIAAKSDDLEEIKKAVEDAASVSGGLWLSYLFVLSYIAIAAGAVTHEDLLLVRPVKLPFLNVELPLKAFFALAPFIVLIIHAYALMHFIMLGKKASRFHNELRRQFPVRRTNTQTADAEPDDDNKEIRDNLRRLLPSNIFVQILAGPPELRTGFFGRMLKLIALITLVVFPILLLLLLQIQFLPFHDVTITWAQRIALFLDIVFLWLLRPPIFAHVSNESSNRSWFFSRPLWGFGLAGATSVAAIWFSIVVATIPAEWQERWQKTGRVAGHRPRCQICAVEEFKVLSTHDFLFAGEVDEITRRRKSLFSNTLVLPGFNLYEALKIVEPKKLAWKEHLFDLRGRHLEQAVFDGADLTKADLTGVQLQGASLGRAQLQGASLSFAKLQGAYLEEVQLQGALLQGAELRGASLDYAQLQGALLITAHLEGASLKEAQLQGAMLAVAQLHGAALDGAEIKATDLTGAFLWRAKWGEIDQPTKLGPLRLANVNWDPAWLGLSDIPPDHSRPWNAKAYDELRVSMNDIPEGTMRDEALQRIEKLDCGNPDKRLASCHLGIKPPPEVSDWQKKFKAAGVDDTAYAKALATVLRGLVCTSDVNAIYILRGLMCEDKMCSGREDFTTLHNTLRGATALVDFIMSKDCPVSTSLTEDDKARLLKFKQDAEKKFARPPASKKEK